MTPTLTKALERASTFFERPITVRSLRERTKMSYSTHPRWFVAAYLRASQPQIYSYPKIGREFGGFDHGTIHHGVRKAHELWGVERFERWAENDRGHHQRVSLEEIMAIGNARLARLSNVGVGA